MDVAAEETRQGSTSKANKPSSDAPRVVYKAHPGTTPEDEARALAAVYSFVLERYRQRQAATTGGDGERNSEPQHAQEPSEERPSTGGSG